MSKKPPFDLIRKRTDQERIYYIKSGQMVVCRLPACDPLYSHIGHVVVNK